MIKKQRLCLVMVLVVLVLVDDVSTTVVEKQCKNRNQTATTEAYVSVTAENVTDVDVCQSGTHPCAVDAVCNTTRSGYQCICKEGFEGDGYTCTKICTGRSFGVGSQCFILSTGYDRKDFLDAVDACRDLGGVLAEPKQMGKLIVKIREMTPEKVMLGWTDRQTEGEWVGMTGQPFRHSDYWIEGEPNSWQGREEDCMEIKFDGLNDSECHEQVNYLCEI